MTDPATIPFPAVKDAIRGLGITDLDDIREVTFGQEHATVTRVRRDPSGGFVKAGDEPATVTTVIGYTHRWSEGDTP